MVKAFLGCVAMAAAILALSPVDWAQWLYWQRGLMLLGLVGLGGLVYGLVLVLLGIRPKQLLDKSA